MARPNASHRPSTTSRALAKASRPGNPTLPSRLRRSSIAVLAGAASLLAAAPAFAQQATSSPGPTLTRDPQPAAESSEGTPEEPKKAEGAFDNPYFPVKAERRSGVVLGLTLGGGASSAAGTPIKFNQRGQRADPGVSGGTGQTLFVGGVFTDWFSFHLGFSASSASKGDYVTSGGEFLFGVEVWPLFPLGGFWRDFGVGGDFGLGSAGITTKEDKDTQLAQGGGDSVIRATVFWDGLRFWRMNLGPYVSYETRTTQTYSEQLYFLGARLAFYGGP